MPSDADLDAILDHASAVLVKGRRGLYDFRYLFDQWLARRLENATPIPATRLAGWLRNIRSRDEDSNDAALRNLKAYFERDPARFDEIFDALDSSLADRESDFWLFVVHDLRRLLPGKVWPVEPAAFFLRRAMREENTRRASDLYRMHVNWLSEHVATLALTEAGMSFLAERPDVANLLPERGRSCQIDNWRIEDQRRAARQSRKRAKLQADNVAFLSERLQTAEQGTDHRIIIWSTQVFLGVFTDSDESASPRERLTSATNEEIADACIEGLTRYSEVGSSPAWRRIISRWSRNSIPLTHHALELSVFLRRTRSIALPRFAIRDCIAAAITAAAWGNVPNYDETLREAIVDEAIAYPGVVADLLREAWFAGILRKCGTLPRFYDFRSDPRMHAVLSIACAAILESGIDDYDAGLKDLVSFLVVHDRKAIIRIGSAEIARGGQSDKVRAVWQAALFLLDPGEFTNLWKELSSVSDDAFWEAIAIVRGDRGQPVHLPLSLHQRAEITTAVGRRQPHRARPAGTTYGDHNPWDLSNFLVRQIESIASEGTADAESVLGQLEIHASLESYRDIIRHHRAQCSNKLRDSSFAFASPGHVALAIQNKTPATSNDLLAFVVDHLSALSRELNSTQQERYRAYWNEEGRTLLQPKYEDVCSALLAYDLQGKLAPHGLNANVEHHMVADKECDIVVLQGAERILPIEAKHHYNRELWTAWRTQLDRLYTRDAKAGGLGIYLVFWSGEASGRTLPKPPAGIDRPVSATQLADALIACIPHRDRHRLRVLVIDISQPAA